jgi:hypothetical protein
MAHVAREQLGRKSAGTTTELTGSMLMSAVVVAVITFLTLIVADPHRRFHRCGRVLVGRHHDLLGTWLLLIPGEGF